jgi:hypothetical protein
MTPTLLGLCFAAATLAMMFTGMPIAFALGSVAVAFMYLILLRAGTGPENGRKRKPRPRLILKRDLFLLSLRPRKKA